MLIEIRDSAGNRLASAPSIEGCLAELVDLVGRYRQIVMRDNERFGEWRNAVAQERERCAAIADGISSAAAAAIRQPPDLSP